MPKSKHKKRGPIKEKKKSKAKGKSKGKY